jgi:signal transduction histidine kinase/ligand-binding sensor domain-containing protein/DNA-binding response OmpR family regulator
MRYFLAFVVFLGLGSASQRVFAQPQQYKFRHLDIQEGLSNSQVKTIFKDSKGFVWFGTGSGLNRYDGYGIKVFQSDPQDTTSIHDSDVTKIFEDPDGNVWLTTWTGLAYYNPETEFFSRNTGRLLKKFGVPQGAITDILKDHHGNYWFAHATEGLFLYNSFSKAVTGFRHSDMDSMTVFSNQVSIMREDTEGNIWLLHKSGVVERLDTRTNKITFRTHHIKKIVTEEVPEFNLTIDSDNDLWIFVSNTNKGVFYVNTKTGKLSQITKTSSPWRLNTDIVRGVVQDDRGLIWVGTDHGGINLLDKKKLSVRYILNNPEDEMSLAQNSLNSLYKDRDGFIWAGTFKKGVSFYHENAIRFQLYRHQTSDKNSLPFNDINAFAEDHKGNLWIGTNGGGLLYFDRAANTFRQYLNDPSNPNSLTNNVIVSLLYDRDHKLWIGTYFGGMDCFDGSKFIHYKPDPKNPQTSIGDISVWEIFEDSRRNLWIGTHSKGVDVYDRNKGTFLHYRTNEENTIHSSYIPAFIEDREGNVWSGTGYGIYILEKQTGKMIHYLNQPNNPNSLHSNNVISLLEDSFGMIWIGTREGLSLFDPKTKIFRAFRRDDGLPHNIILTLVEDLDKNIWMGTPNGISNLVVTRDANGGPTSFVFKNYDASDGLQGKQFNENSAIKTRRGELIFGGSNGFNIFRPHDIVLNESKVKVILTDFQIFNNTVRIGEEIDGHVVLTKSISETDHITLRPSENVFSLEFAALTYFNPEKSRYKYILENFNKDWLETDAAQRRVTYTNLDPGDYVFKVIASNNDGVWNDTPTQLSITVLPPFWKTKIAFVIYVVVVLLALLFSRRLILERERMKYRIRQERQEAQQLHELDMMKLKFFTNVSHEFRTPLTLIITPLEKMLRNTTDNEQKKQFQLIQRNARRLLNLVNQLLDFRRMEVQEVKLNASEGDIIGFIREASNSFNDLSEKKNISFSFQSSVDSLESVFDKDKLEKILFNLLSNAFKFTPDSGSVTVNTDVVDIAGVKNLRIKVSDTGIGIPADKQEKIFERFFQSDLPKSMVNQGSGIGLSITKEFVKAHGGTIEVESASDKGSTFTVFLPVTEINADYRAAEEVEENLPELEEVSETNGQQHKPVLLLVEDNEDFRFYLKDNLKFQYRIIEASNGKSGLKQALENIPDLIVSDVMMPEMNGIDLCKKLKNEKSTSHIPVILLTARTAEEQKVEGFESGADDYVTKPFNFEILQSRIKNLIHQRELFQKDFRRQIEVRASDVKITSLDEKLIQNAIRFVEQNISNPDFSVEDLSRELAMSRVHLYKKLQALTGKAPLEFIRSIRLQHAAQLLEKSQLTVSEVAYKVGFNNPKYFARYFKEEYNVLPSAYASGKR